MNIYKAFYNQKEIQFEAKSQWEAVQIARKELKVPKSKFGLLSVILAAKDNKPVVHSTASIF